MTWTLKLKWRCTSTTVEPSAFITIRVLVYVMNAWPLHYYGNLAFHCAHVFVFRYASFALARLTATSHKLNNGLACFLSCLLCNADSPCRTQHIWLCAWVSNFINACWVWDFFISGIFPEMLSYGIWLPSTWCNKFGCFLHARNLSLVQHCWHSMS